MLAMIYLSGILYLIASFLPIIVFIIGIITYIIRRILGKRDDAKGIDIKWTGVGDWDSNWSNYV